uniref:Uncharacterized protein n=1 Tax=Oryza meridionalis TaxID=40149 RepID=A0A0E0C4Q5_9ORYZ
MYKSSIQAGKTGSQQINQQEWEMEERKGSRRAWVPSLHSYHSYQIREKRTKYYTVDQMLAIRAPVLAWEHLYWYLNIISPMKGLKSLL